MAFILKSTKLIHGLFIFSRQRGLMRRKNYFFLQNLNAFDFNQSRLRTITSLPAAESKEKEDEYFEKSLFQLSRDIQNRSVYVEDIKNVYNAIKQKGEITYPQLLILLKCCSGVSFMCSNEERIKLAEDIWKTASEFGTKFHISHYNALLNVFLENKHKFSPSQFLTILKNEGVQPNLVTYRRILRAYCQQGDIEGANGVLQKMREENLPMNEDDFNSLIVGYCEAGNLKEACETLEIMQEKDIDPSSRSYTYLLCGYAKHGEIQKLQDLMKKLPEKDIGLSEYQILEIVYILAVNGKAEHIDFVLQGFGNVTQIGKASKMIIQRLLHDKMDSLALEIFERIERMLQSSNFVTDGSKKILSHYVMYRSPPEVLHLCEKVEVKGWFKTALSYVLKESFLNRNEKFCLQLLNEMKDRNMEVRYHYYWPIIIKASEKGNSHMLNILRSIPRNLLPLNRSTMLKVIAPNYKITKNWRNDIDAFVNLGYNRSVLAMCFIEKFLSQLQFDKVEMIASSFPVHSPVLTANRFARLLSTHPEEDERFVNVVYLLAHDFHFNSLKNVPEEGDEELTEEADGEGSEEVAAGNKPDLGILDHVLPSLSRNIKNEEVFRRILEGLLKKKLAISPRTASVVTNSLANKDLVNLVNQLANPELKFELNEGLVLSKKYKFGGQTRSKNLSVDVDVLLKNFECSTSLEDQVTILRQLVDSNKCQEALQLAEQLPQDDVNSSEYISFVFDLYRAQKPDLGEKALNLGIQKGFLGPENRLSLSRWLASRGKTSEAVDLYCSYVEQKKRVPEMISFLNRVVPTKNQAATKKLLSTFSEYVPENIVLSYLTLALALDGQMKQAKKLLESNKFTLKDKDVYTHLEVMFRATTTEQFENILKLLKETEVDRIPMYKLLIRKYAKDHDVEKAKKLWLLIEEEDTSNYDFLEQIREFYNNPTVDTLIDLSNKLETMEYSGPMGTIMYKSLLEQGQLRKAFLVAMQGNLPEHLVQNLIHSLAVEGKTSEVLQVISKYKIRDSVKETAKTFLRSKRVKEYVEFLNHFAAKEEFQVITDCFGLTFSMHTLRHDKETFAKYKSLALKCYEKTNSTSPLRCCFTACVCIKDNLQEAEEILEQYSDTMRSVSFSELRKLAKPLEMEFLSNFLTSEKLKAFYADDLPAVFSNLIVFFCLKNNLPNALSLLNTAVDSGIKDSIDKDSLCFLERKLLTKGKSFPYPELLEPAS